MKKIFLLLGFICLASVNIYAQSFKMKFYSDFNKGYTGWAVAVYVEPHQRSMVETNFNALSGRTINKLSNNFIWLAQQALNEWDYKNGDIFMIQMSETRDGNSGIVLYATIINVGKSFNWLGKSVP